MEERQALELFLENRTEESFCALFESLYGRVRRYFLLRGLGQETAEELAQNVLFIVYRRAGEVREKDHFLGWVFKVAKNELLGHWRKEHARNEIFTTEQLSDEMAEQLLAELDAARASNFAEWVTYLEPVERELIILRFVEELSYEELAVALGIPIGTVKWRLFNAKKRLAEIIRASQPDRERRIN